MDKVPKEVRSKMMAAVRGKDTKLELRLRKELWKRGYRYRIHYGKHRIDIAFPKRKVAVFVDSCFWHMCPLHGTLPKSNAEYWIPKLKKNAERDKGTTESLEARGWTVLRMWEHELGDIDGAIDRIRRSLSR